MKLDKTQSVIDCKIGKGTVLRKFINLYGCTIGEDSKVGTFVEIQRGAVLGNRVFVQSHSFICEGVTIQDDVFIGHHVVFVNDNHPTVGKTIQKTWKLSPVLVKKGATIGSNATILGGVTIGQSATIGAGAVVTKNVPDHAIVIGNPARILRKRKAKG
jgi:UDP-2-acetamido-3-amino-2,3-dideoxy-glucuronate N-acetyltransferase